MLAILLVEIAIWSSVSSSADNNRTPSLITPQFKGENISALVFYIKIMGEDTILGGRREWKKMAPASLTKIMTSLLAIENLSPRDLVVFSPDAKNVEEKTSLVKTGGILRRDDAIKLTMVGSANDASLALAQAVGKMSGTRNFSESLEIFRRMMNERAWSLGLDDTHFQNPVGLDAERHETTARDLARLAEYVWRYQPEIWQMSRQQETEVYSLDDIKYKIPNTNILLAEFPAILGSKTGFTDNAKEALLFFYPVKPDKTAVVVIMGSEDRVSDGRKIIDWLEDLDSEERLLGDIAN